jgi:hypothetical protein
VVIRVENVDAVVDRVTFEEPWGLALLLVVLGTGCV